MIPPRSCNKTTSQCPRARNSYRLFPQAGTCRDSPTHCISPPRQACRMHWPVCGVDPLQVIPCSFFRKTDGVDIFPILGPGDWAQSLRLPQEALLLSFNCYLRVECPGEGTCLYPGLSVPRLAPLNAVLLILPGLDQPVRVSLQPPDPVSWRPGLPGSPAGLGTGGNTAIWQPKQSTSWPEPHTYVGPGWGWGRHSSRTKPCVTRQRQPPLTLRATACPLLQSGSSKVSCPHPCSKGAQEEEKIRWELWPTNRWVLQGLMMGPEADIDKTGSKEQGGFLTA